MIAGFVYSYVFIPPVPRPSYSPKPSQQDPALLFSQEALNIAMTTPFPDDSDDDEDQWVTISDATYESDTSDEFVMPEMEELMLESTSELDNELARLLAAKIPASYKRQGEDSLSFCPPAELSWVGRFCTRKCWHFHVIFYSVVQTSMK